LRSWRGRRASRGNLALVVGVTTGSETTRPYAGRHLQRREPLARSCQWAGQPRLTRRASRFRWRPGTAICRERAWRSSSSVSVQRQSWRPVAVVRQAHQPPGHRPYRRVEDRWRPGDQPAISRRWSVALRRP
jgi:hypothetical protein